MAFYSQGPGRVGFQPVPPLLDYRLLAVLDRRAVKNEKCPVSVSEVRLVRGGRDCHGGQRSRGDPDFFGGWNFMGEQSDDSGH
jgi:hypothetical protein